MQDDILKIKLKKIYCRLLGKAIIDLKNMKLPTNIADDMVQETIEKVWIKRANIRDDEFENYIFAALHFNIISYKRRKKEVNLKDEYNDPLNLYTKENLVNKFEFKNEIDIIKAYYKITVNYQEIILYSLIIFNDKELGLKLGVSEKDAIVIRLKILHLLSKEYE